MVWLIGLPRWAQGLLGAAGLGLAVLVWFHFHDKAVVNQHEAKVTAAVATQSATAADAAATEVSETHSTVERTNEKARSAAASSPDDRLRAGLNSLRANQSTDRPATR